MPPLTARTFAWRHAGTLTSIGGHQIFVRERAGTTDSPPLLFLHGYPSSSYDWRHALERLGARRLIMFDFLGFGLSDKPRDQVYSLLTQADIAEAIVARFAAERVVLVAHDMGSSVATELLARDLEGRLPFELVSVLLFNASLVLERASLTIGQKLLRGRLGPLAARLTTELGFRRQFGAIFSDAHPLSDEEAADQWSLLACKDGHRLLDRLIFYLHERITYAPRWKGALRNWPGRLELGWADLDPICTEAVLQAVLELRPHVPLTRLPGLGHYPQLEDPQRRSRSSSDSHLGPDRPTGPAGRTRNAFPGCARARRQTAACRIVASDEPKWLRLSSYGAGLALSTPGGYRAPGFVAGAIVLAVPEDAAC